MSEQERRAQAPVETRHRYNGGETPEEIEEELQYTRSEIRETLHEIEQRLSPGQLMDQAIDYLRGGPGEFGANLGRTVRDNPVPVMLIGIGIAWLAAAGSPSARAAARAASDRVRGAVGGATTTDYDYKMGMSGAYAGQGPGVTGRAREWGEHARGSMQQATEQARSGMEHARSGVRHAAEQARDSMQHMASQTRERAGRMGESMRYQGQRARDMFSYLLHEQPLALGALGLALGAMLGAGLPRTRREDELMGRTRDDLMHKAKEAGEQQVHAAEGALEQAGRKAGEKVSQTSESLAHGERAPQHHS